MWRKTFFHTKFEDENFAQSKDNIFPFFSYIFTLSFFPADCSFLLANAQIVDYPIVYCSENFVKISGYNRAEVMQKSCRCTFMYGDVTEKMTINKIENALDSHSMDQFEILLYKKNRKFILITPNIHLKDYSLFPMKCEKHWRWSLLDDNFETIN